jgi:hypothetical protein
LNSHEKARLWTEFLAAREEIASSERLLQHFNVGAISRICVSAFASVVACANDMVSAVGASEKVSPGSSSRQAKSFAPSLHWYEATGIGKRELKIKAFL